MSFTDETSKKVRDEFDKKRKAAQDDADARRAEIHSRIPEIELIDKELANTGHKQSRKTAYRDAEKYLYSVIHRSSNRVKFPQKSALSAQISKINDP